MSGLGLLQRPPFNPLAYPAGRALGFDPTHPFSTATIISTVAVGGGNHVNVLTGQPGATSTSPPAYVLDGAIGPTSYNNTTAAGRIAFDPAVATGAVVTCAAIFRKVDNGSNNFQGLLQTSTFSANKGAWIGFDGSNAFQFILPGVSSVSSGLTLSNGTPYFAAASYSKAVGLCNFIVTNLQTGQLLSASVVNFSSTPTAGDGNYTVGFAVGNGSNDCRIAATMANVTYYGLPILKLWAADPWSFWYPRRGPGPDLSLELVGKKTAVNVNLIAASATGAVVSFKPSISKTLVAAAATGTAEGLKPTDQRVLTAVAAVGAVEAFKPSISKTLVDAAATGAAEAFKPALSKALVDVAATAAAGSLTRANVVSLAAAAATGTAGSLLSEISVRLASAAASGGVGSFTIPTPPSAGVTRDPNMASFGPYGHMGHRR